MQGLRTMVQDGTRERGWQECSVEGTFKKFHAVANGVAVAAFFLKRILLGVEVQCSNGVFVIFIYYCVFCEV